MTTATGSVRSLRYALACALADAVDDGGRPRTAEAVAELDLALAEAGADPPDRRINIAAGRMLERRDPAKALERYVSALDGDTTEEAATRARILLEASPKPASLAAPIATRTLERVVELAPGSEQLTLLASTLLRLRGRDADALTLLQRAYEADGPPGKDVLSHLAQTRLDLDQVDEAVTLVDREDTDGREPSLQLVRAHALLIRGEYRQALELADRLSTGGADLPAVHAVAALSLLGLSRPDDALARVSAGDATEIRLARAIVALQRREYQSARAETLALVRLRPDDPDVLLVNAQTVVEALGAARAGEAAELESSSTGADDQPPGAEIDAARRLMADVARALSELGAISRWWRTQRAVRLHDGHYRYFLCELQFAQHSGPSPEEIEQVDRSSTAWAQDGALEEIKAAVLQAAGDAEGAAAAFDAACEIFRSSAVDTQRALECARSAHGLVPTFERTVTYMERALYASYGPNVEPDSARQALQAAHTLAEGSLPDAGEDDDLEGLVNVLAWTRLRLSELDDSAEPGNDSPSVSAAALLPWLFAGVAVRPGDADLRAALAYRLGSLDISAAAVLEANAAAAATPASDYVADSALTANMNYFGTPETTGPWLARLADDDPYRNSMEVRTILAVGDRVKLAERRNAPVYDNAWAQVDHAIAIALLDGVPEATPQLEAGLEALTESPDLSSDQIVIAALLRRQDDAAAYLANAERDPETNETELKVGRLVARFGFDPEMTVEECARRALELCRTPVECALMTNVTLPLLEAARSGARGPVQPVSFDADLLRARIAELEDVPARSVHELDTYRAGMGSLVALAAADSGPAQLSAAASQAILAWSEELGPGVGERIVGLLMRRAFDKLPLRLVQARLDLGPPVDPADILSAIAGSSGLAASQLLLIALLDDSLAAERRGAIAAEAAAGDIDAAAQGIRGALGEARPNAEDGSVAAAIADYWKIDALFQARQDDPEETAILREAAASARGHLTGRLDTLLGLVGKASEAPVLLPIIVEVGDALVPIVDSRKDGGRFLYELIPAMRDRIVARTGVTVPGVRMRGAPALAGDGYSILMFEVRVLGGSVPLDVSRAVVPADGGLEPGGELTDFHPLTGERGLWSLNPVEHGEDGGGAPLLDPAQYLIHRIELVFRTHLARLLGPQEVDTLVDTWANADGELVSAVLPHDGRLRLTWVLQALVDDGVPITEWRAVLSAIRDAGGITAPVPTLVRAARARLRHQLPGTGRTLVAVPAELETALTGPAGEDARSPRDPQHEFLTWLRQTVSESGPAVALVTSNGESREHVDALARGEGDLITALSSDELAAD